MPEWEFLAAVAKQGGLLPVAGRQQHLCQQLIITTTIPSTTSTGIPIGTRLATSSRRAIPTTATSSSIRMTRTSSIPVWTLYEETAKRFGPVSTMIERDGNIPELDQVLAELDHARRIAEPYYQA